MCWGSKILSVNTVKLGKTLKNMTNDPAKIAKKSVFGKMKLAGFLMNALHFRQRFVLYLKI